MCGIGHHQFWRVCSLNWNVVSELAIYSRTLLIRIMFIFYLCDRDASKLSFHSLILFVVLCISGFRLTVSLMGNRLKYFHDFLFQFVRAHFLFPILPTTIHKKNFEFKFYLQNSTFYNWIVQSLIKNQIKCDVSVNERWQHKNCEFTFARMYLDIHYLCGLSGEKKNIILSVILFSIWKWFILNVNR